MKVRDRRGSRVLTGKVDGRQYNAKRNCGTYRKQPPSSVRCRCCSLCARCGGGRDTGEDFKTKGDIADGMESLRRTLLQAVAHNAFQCWRNIEGGIGEFWRLLLKDRAHGVSCGFTMKCTFPRDHFVQNGAERKNVRAGVCVFPSDLLWRHIADRSHDHAGFGGDLDGGGIATFAR